MTTGYGRSGGGSSHSSAHVGRFGRTRPANRGPGHRLLRTGLGYERITGGIASSIVDNVLYIGHSTWPAATIVKAACMAVLRRAYKELGIDLNRGNSIVPVHALATSAGFSWIGRSNELTQVTFVSNFTPGTTTVESASTEMARAILRTMYGAYDGGTVSFVAAPVKWNTFFLTNNSATPSAGAQISLSDTVLEFSMSSMLKIQNISFNSLVSADPDVDQATNVNNITLEGYHYKGYGNHMLMKGYTNNNTLSSAYGTTNEPPITTDRDTGLMRKNPTSTLATGFQMDLTPVKPYQWQNCSRGASIYLDPGSAKTDYINQRKVTTWQNFLDKLLSAGTNTNTNPTTEDGVLLENWSNQGKFSGFGLSRLINYDAAGTSPTSLQCLYELEQKIYCSVARVNRTMGVAHVAFVTGANFAQS